MSEALIRCFYSAKDNLKQLGCPEAGLFLAPARKVFNLTFLPSRESGFGCNRGSAPHNKE